MKNNNHKIYIVLLIVLLLVGCGSNQITIGVESIAATNDGGTFFAVVRTVEIQTYMLDTYDYIESRVFATPADESVLAARAIFPGQYQEIIVDMPEQKVLGVYFLFTNPGDRWKTLIKQPLPSGYYIELGKNEIESAY